MSGLVSIITPSYNSSRFIKASIDSVLSQTYQDWEMIIVDDKSPDNSNKIIENYIKNDSRIRLIKLNKNSGPAIARNRAIKEAAGRYIAFLDADDVWLPLKLQKQIKFMQGKDICLSYTEYIKIDENSTEISGVIHSPRRVDYAKMLRSNYIPCLTAIYDTKMIGKVYMPNILKRQDYGLWLKILKQIDYAYALNEPLAKYRIYHSSVSSNKFIAALYVWKLFREVEKLNIIQASYYFVNYVIISFIKFRK